MRAFEAAVGCSAAARSAPTFWRAWATRREAILDICDTLLALGVYPFVVPFVPISGTPLEDHPAPRRTSCIRSSSRYRPHAWPRRPAVRDIKAGCGKCGACSSLSTYEG
jgi:biotin synthase-related radical SAM superfamily protein